MISNLFVNGYQMYSIALEKYTKGKNSTEKEIQQVIKPVMENPPSCSKGLLKLKYDIQSKGLKEVPDLLLSVDQVRKNGFKNASVISFDEITEQQLWFSLEQMIKQSPHSQFIKFPGISKPLPRNLVEFLLLEKPNLKGFLQNLSIDQAVICSDEKTIFLNGFERLYLSTQSPFFRALWTGGFKECNLEKSINLEITSQNLEKLFQSDNQISNEDLLEFLNLAHQWQLSSLEKKLEKRLIEVLDQLDETDFESIYPLAVEYSLSSLQANCEVIFSRWIKNSLQNIEEFNRIMEVLSKLQPLSLDLSKTQLCEEHFTALKSLPLQRFNLSQCHLTDAGIENFLTSSLALEELNLSFCQSLTNAGIDKIFEKCPRLRALHLNQCPLLTDEAIKQFKSSQLEILYLKGCKLLTGEGIKELIKNCPKLKVLDLSLCEKLEDRDVEELFNTTGNTLQELHLNWSDRLTDVAAHHIANNCSKLKSLQMTRWSHLTDKGLNEITQKCLDLQALVLNGCQELKGEGLKMSNELKSLSLSECNHIEEGNIQKLIQSCPGLRSLDLEFCYQLTDKGIQNIVSECSHLQSLNLSRCTNLGQEGMKGIMDYCYHLQTLNIAGCSNVTIQSLRELIDRCPHLKTLSLKSCPQLTNEECQEIQNLLAVRKS